MLLLLLTSCWSSVFFHPIIITIILLLKLTLFHSESSIQKKNYEFKIESNALLKMFLSLQVNKLQGRIQPESKN